VHGSTPVNGWQSGKVPLLGSPALHSAGANGCFPKAEVQEASNRFERNSRKTINKSAASFDAPRSIAERMSATIMSRTAFKRHIVNIFPVRNQRESNQGVAIGAQRRDGATSLMDIPCRLTMDRAIRASVRARPRRGA
jgi:hypothetical protein